uniref:GPI alpha-1,4-mannosyltransferase I, catalytic subunit n=1 Tax=Elaeophora elaphi TaxID=1147741 RepID=A0A158Q7G2_9BILA
MIVKERKASDKRVLEDIEGPGIWKRKQILLLSFLCRVILVYYGRIHDYLFEVQFTDIDYKVYSDAAKYIYHGQSPYEKATYRYTPLLAWLLMPVVKWPEFGKILFCAVDVAVGFLYFELSACSWAVCKDEDESRMKKSVVIFWLANPFTAIISSRGNADVLVCAVVIWTLYLLMRDQWCLAALVYGLLPVHLKLYPVIYLPSIFLSLSSVSLSSGWIDYGKRLISNVKGFIFLLIFSSSLLALMVIYYVFYGMPYVNEALLYHLHRTDTRHNFSPYFYLLYLAVSNTQLSRVISFCAFLPQAALIILFAFRFYDDLPFCWLITTAVFVSFNKVCTSQYFIWYICLLPIAQRSIEIPAMRAVYLIILWFMGQVFWLFSAYLFEFQGLNTFCLIWLSSLFFLIVNTGIIAQLIRRHDSKRSNLLRHIKIYLIEMLYLVGLGLGNLEDITIKGMAIVQKCSHVYLECYTSIMSFGMDKEKLEDFFDKEILEADRAMIELNCDDLIDKATNEDVCLLVVGDPFGATTHTSLVLSARRAGVDVEIVHNASIINAVGCCGLQLYRFGEIISIPFWETNWRPDSYYFKIVENRKRGLHTLCLLDIKVKEQTVDDMMRGLNRFLPPKYMTCSEAAKQLLEIADSMTKVNVLPAYLSNTQCVALARIGWPDQKIVFCSLEALCNVDMGPPLHSLIIPGDLHDLELDFLKSFPEL